MVAVCLRHDARDSDIDSLWRLALTSFHPRLLTSFSSVHVSIFLCWVSNTFWSSPRCEKINQLCIMSSTYLPNETNVIYISCYSGYIRDRADPGKLWDMNTGRFCIEIWMQTLRLSWRLEVAFCVSPVLNQLKMRFSLRKTASMLVILPLCWDVVVV